MEDLQMVWGGVQYSTRVGGSFIGLGPTRVIACARRLDLVQKAHGHTHHISGFVRLYLCLAVYLSATACVRLCVSTSASCLRLSSRTLANTSHPPTHTHILRVHRPVTPVHISQLCLRSLSLIVLLAAPASRRSSGTSATPPSPSTRRPSTTRTSPGSSPE